MEAPGAIRGFLFKKKDKTMNDQPKITIDGKDYAVESLP